MMKQKWIGTLIVLTAFAVGAQADPVEITSNGNFETGNTSGWQYFPTASSTFGVTPLASEGLFGGEIINLALASAAVVKQSNLGIGLVNPGDEITISFSAFGEGMVGGVVFAEFFSESSSGPPSSSEILGGAPLMLNPTTYAPFSFTTTAGPDVSAGVTLQFAVVTGGAVGSTSSFVLDDVSVTVVPEPGTASLLGLSAIGLMAARRRRRW